TVGVLDTLDSGQNKLFKLSERIGFAHRFSILPTRQCLILIWSGNICLISNPSSAFFKFLKLAVFSRRVREIERLAIEQQIASPRSIVPQSNNRSPPRARSSADRTTDRLPERDRLAIEQQMASPSAIVWRSNNRSPPRARSSGDRTTDRLPERERLAI